MIQMIKPKLNIKKLKIKKYNTQSQKNIEVDTKKLMIQPPKVIYQPGVKKKKKKTQNYFF